PLLLGSELQNIFDQELGLILVVSDKGRGRGAGESPAIVLALEKAGRHGGAGTDGLWVDNPALYPIGFEAALGLEEVGRGCGLIVSGITSGVAFQTRRGRAAEQGTRHVDFLGGKLRPFFRNVGKRLS